MITTLLQGERQVQPVPFGRFRATQMSLSRQRPFIPPQILPVWEPRGVLQLCRKDPESLELLLVKEAAVSPSPGSRSLGALDPPRPQHTLPLAGEALPPLREDNRPFPGKSLHAALQTDPQSTAADG